MPSNIERALHWLRRSGIRISDMDDRNHGAVYSFFDARTMRYRMLYAEATGYLLSFLKYVGATQPGCDLDGEARASADWLLRWMAEHQGAVPLGIDADVTIRQTYAFDAGICAKGLLDIHDVSRDSRYLKAAHQILKRLVTTAVNHDGSVKAGVNLESGRAVNDEKVWYMASGSFHAKISMPLLQLSSISGDETFAAVGRKMCEWTLRQQSTDGGFPANTAMNAVNLHAHCYATEALLYAYAKLGTPLFREAAEKAIRWIHTRQAPNGSLKLWHGAHVLKPRASYAIAQSIRLFVLLYTLTHEETLAHAARRSAAFLERMQASSTDTRIDGGFYGQDITRSGMLIRKNRDVTSWATMFAIQALDLLPRMQSLSFNESINWLF